MSAWPLRRGPSGRHYTVVDPVAQVTVAERRPRRIQRRRTKGWRMPEGAIYVGRPSRWGNRYVVGERPHPNHIGGGVFPCDCAAVTTAEQSVALYRAERAVVRMDLAPLRGHDLVCWCKTCDEHADGLPLGVECAQCPPCHADVLLELANG